MLYNESMNKLKTNSIIFIVLMSAFFACNEVQVKVPIVKEGEALFENTCGSEYVETLKAHEAFYGDNPPLIVFKKIPKKSK